MVFEKLVLRFTQVRFTWNVFFSYDARYIFSLKMFKQASQVEAEKPVKLQEPLVPKTVQVK